MNWQPIETAPKDGRRVDLWSAQGFRYPNAAWDTVDHSVSAESPYGWTDINHHGSIDECGPFTHWMPLPEPPQ